MKIIIRNIKAGIADTEADALAAAEKRLKRARISYEKLYLSKKSVDARKKNDIHWVCSVTAELPSGAGIPDINKLSGIDAVPLREEKISPVFGKNALTAPPVIVGFGPCGMFAALMLAENGYAPIVIERGGNIANRRAAVAAFYESGELDPSCNVQFGAGGAGTFSDGKLVTRINDPKCSYVLDRFVEFGAPEDIRVNAKPHIGTDLLTGIVDNIAERIEALGGRIYYNTTFEKVNTDISGRAVSVSTDRGDIACGALVLALGHSARDTYKYLISSSFDIQPKAFSVGVRIEHLQSELNYAMYGDIADLLPPAEYTLSRRNGERGVYSFCMCPGGEVVAAASETGGVVTNGMSRRARNGRNANAAIAVSVLASDCANDPMKAIGFQRELEKKAFAAAGSNYRAPVQTVGDFMSGRRGSEPTKVLPSYMGGGKTTLCDLNGILPQFVTDMLKLGIADFGKQISGFDAPYAILTGVETRTSAPLRILRNEEYTASGHDNIYPCGEGAGYAGGITSAAVDGISCALKIMEKYKKIK